NGPLTYTCMPPGSGARAGIDRDEDGYLDRDELDAGSDPADPNSIPSGAPLGSKLLLIKNKLPDDESKNKVVYQSNDPAVILPVPGSPDDPRCNGDPNGTVKVTFSLSSTASGESHTTGLPCEGWSLIGK